MRRRRPEPSRAPAGPAPGVPGRGTRRRQKRRARRTGSVGRSSLRRRLVARESPAASLSTPDQPRQLVGQPRADLLSALWGIVLVVVEIAAGEAQLGREVEAGHM